MKKIKLSFDAWLTGEPTENEHWWSSWCIHFLPRVTLFIDPMVEVKKDWKGDDCLCIVGKEYDLQIGWLVFEISLELDVRKD